MSKSKLIYILGSTLLLMPLCSRAQQVSKPVVQNEKNDSMKVVLSKLHFKPRPVVGKDYHYVALGFACKLELKMEKATKVPLRLRVGSLQQTDYMEQKPNSPKPE